MHSRVQFVDVLVHVAIVGPFVVDEQFLLDGEAEPQPGLEVSAHHAI